MLNKFIKLFLALFLVFACFGVNQNKINAAGNRVIDVGTEITEEEVEMFEMNPSEIILENITNQYELMELNKEYKAIYKDAIDYYGDVLDLEITVVYNRNYIGESGDEETGQEIKFNDKTKRIDLTTTPLKKPIDPFNLEEEGVKYTVKTAFLKDGQPYRFTGIIGFSDPDGAEYAFDSTGREIYYKNAEFNKDYQPAESCVVHNAAEGFEVRREGLFRIDLGCLRASWDSAIFFVSLNNESEFEFVSYSRADYLTVPYFGKLHKNFNISYELNGGENNPDNPTSYISGNAHDIKDPKPREGYVFAGWKEGNKITEKDFGNKKFTAQWTPIEYSINYVLDGGENNPNNPETYNIEERVELEQPSKEGYKFTGWKEGYVIPEGSTGEKTFTATWEPEEYTITYDIPEGFDIPETNPKNYTIETPDTPIAVPEKEGYECKWIVGEDILKHGTTGNLTYKAECNLIEYPISYNLNGGKEVHENPGSYTIEDEVLLKPTSKEHYEFVGWKEGSKISKGSQGSKTFTAEFKPIDYKITINLPEGFVNNPDNPSVYNIESKDIEIKAPVKEGYYCKIKEESSIIKSGSTGEKIFNVECKKLEYEIKYILNDATNDSTNPTKYSVDDALKLKAPQKQGHVCSWKEGNKIEKGSTGEKVFTAECKVKPIEVVNTGFGDGTLITLLSGITALTTAAYISIKKKED